MKILDCTLRDGGYYTNWTFDDSLVKSMVSTLDNYAVDIIELGYKSPVKGGPYRKCNDGYIKNIIDFKVDAGLSFMIDAKDFINSDLSINYNLLNDCIKDAESSPFSVCRLAIKNDEILLSKYIAQFILDKGYFLIINLMGVSLVEDTDIKNFIHNTENLASVLYFADSYGHLMPTDISRICNLFQNSTHLDCGVHCHDNLGLAFANSLEAIRSGFSYVDSTVCGMGRGVGNTRTEQVLLHKYKVLTPQLLELVNSFEKLKSVYGWGFNPMYMVAGLNHIHPLFIQDLTSSNLNPVDLSNALIKLKYNNKYDKNQIKELTKQKAVVVIPARHKSSRFPGKPLAKILGKEMILYVAEKAEIAVGAENVYIATENDEIATLVKNAGYRVILTSDNCLTGTDRIAEASLEIDADIIVNVQGDEPMINPNDILKAIEAKKQNPNCVINCMAPLNADENYNDIKIPKVVCNKNNILLYASRNALPGSKSGKSENVMKQVCIYAFNKTDLINFASNKKTPLEYQEDIEILRFIENGIPVKMLKVDHTSYAVDYPEDISIIERKLDEIQTKNR